MKKSPWLNKTLVISPVPYALCKTDKAFKKTMRDMGLKNKQFPDFIGVGADASTHIFDCDGESCAIVCIGEHNETHSQAEIAGLLTHEAVHVWQEIRAILGENSPSAEFEAYSIQSIAQNLIEAYSA